MYARKAGKYFDEGLKERADVFALMGKVRCEMQIGKSILTEISSARVVHSHISCCVIPQCFISCIACCHSDLCFKILFSYSIHNTFDISFLLRSNVMVHAL